MATVMIARRAEHEAARFVDWLVLLGVPRETAADGVRKFVEVVAGKRVKSPPPTPGALQPLVRYFTDMYGARHRGEAPVLTEKDFVLLARLQRQFGDAVVRARLRAFADVFDADTWVRQRGFTPATFFGQWSKIAALAAEDTSVPTNCRHSPPCRSTEEHSGRWGAQR